MESKINPKYEKSLFIFHRDLSIEDNIGLYECLSKSNEVYLAFIFTPEQITKKNKYFNIRVIKFMIECLKFLSEQVHINFYYTKSKYAIKEIIKKYKISAVWENRDFSPFAKLREKSHREVCKKYKINHILCDTITISPIGDFLIKKDPIKAYIKFTPFYKNAIHKIPKKPINLDKKHDLMDKISTKKINTSYYITLEKIEDNLDYEMLKKNKKEDIKTDIDFEIEYIGGRSEAKILLKTFLKRIDDYVKYRNYPAIDITSHLGPHFHFGTLSMREILHETLNMKTKGAKEFIKQIYWREFYIYIVNYVSTTYDKSAVTLPKFNKIIWSKNNSEDKFKLWCQGKTGVPIVDAGMRELLKTGNMHNRLRMIAAMYLIHYLNINWEEGERWYAMYLLDYDYPNNYGGWVWCAGTETHSNPYFRIFSMKSQHTRFDKESKYVKYWCPEYRDMEPKEILKIYDNLKLDVIRSKRIDYLMNI